MTTFFQGKASKLIPLLPWLLLVGVYLIIVGPYLLDNTFWMDRDRDNVLLQFNSFNYWAGSLEHGFGIPSWYPHGGGSPLGLSALSWKPFLPHRLLGYGLAILTNFDYITIFKFILILGLLVSSLGWYLFTFDVFRNPFAAFFATVPVVFGGFGTTIFHQEYILGHLSWVPWLLILLRRVEKRPRLLLVISTILGVGITCDYPHFLVYATIFFLFVIFTFSKSNRLALTSFLKIRKNILLIITSAAILFACAAPLVFIAINKNEYSSPIRGGETPTYKTLKEYEIGALGPSVSFKNMLQYVSPVSLQGDDIFALFVGRTILVFGLISLIFGFRRSIVSFATVLMFFWVVLGAYGYLPHLLYIIKFPYANIFRQWYHLFPYLNWALAFWGGLGYSILFLKKYDNKFAHYMKIIVLVSAPLLLLGENIQYFKMYEKRFMTKEIGGFKKGTHPTKDEYLKIINMDWTKWVASQSVDQSWGVPAGTKLILFSPKQQWSLFKACPEIFPKGSSYAIPDSFEVLNSSLSVTAGQEGTSFEGTIFGCSAPYMFSSSIKKILPFCKNEECTNLKFNWGNLSSRIVLNPDGFDYNFQKGKLPFDLVPINPTLNWNAVENGIKFSNFFPVDEDAFLAIVPTNRERTISFKLPRTLYEYGLLIQILTILFVIVLLSSKFCAGVKSNE